MTANERVNILMVDDQPAKLMSYETILGKLGENLIKANSAEEALNILLKTDIAVVLMDVSMPDVDGFELADLIRQHPRFQKTAIIFISGVHLTDSDKIQGYRSGAVDYISVPVIPEVLLSKVAIFAELHRKTRMLESLNSELEQRVEERTEELRKSQEQFRLRAELIELASDAIIVRDKEGLIQFWNAGAEALYGWAREEMLGQDMHRMLQTVFPVPREEVKTALSERGSWQGVLTQKTKNGAEIIVACRKTLNDEGNAVLEVIRDITAQLRAEEALREAEKLAAMGRVAGIIAHEINNPLAAITNIFYLLRNHPTLDPDARHFAELAEQELDRVSHITRQTLTFYRESKQPLSVDLSELIESVLALQESALQANHIVLKKKYAASSHVWGFPVELRQVFMNLVINASQAMPEGGTLGIRIREVTDWTRKEPMASISIVDTGTGIRPEDARQLFEPFFSTKSTKGTGLGLWISKGIVQKYEGRISFKSQRRANGFITCFRVFLPIAKNSSTPQVNSGVTRRQETNEAQSITA
ncbi:MAG: ATP-binding protein [Terracidiphilus sp.]|jgi:PAS domain S-box-containing protein